MVTGYNKSPYDVDLDNHISKTILDYKIYKKWFKFNAGTKGIHNNLLNEVCSLHFMTIFFKDYEWENKLRYVRIYFDTPTFDRITKDRAAKFVDMLSAIGGTMGLLTGFSIVSGVEILYFAGKFVASSIRKIK